MAAKNNDKIATSGEDVYEYPRVGPQCSDTGDFQDRTISVRDWFTDLFSDIPGQLLYYVKSLFPIATWIHRYNLTWFTGDVRLFVSLIYVQRANYLHIACRLLQDLLLGLSLFRNP